MRENPIYDRQVDDSSRVNIVCAYADLNGEVDSTSCPIATDDLKKFGADYYAFGSRHASSKFNSVGASKYSYCGALECTGFDTSNEIINRISQLISKKKYDGETALKIVLCGYVDPRFSVPKNIENDAFGLYYFKLIDKTLPLFNTEGFKRDMSVKGEIFRQFYPLLIGDDEEARLVSARAFRVALAALENREIDV